MYTGRAVYDVVGPTTNHLVSRDVFCCLKKLFIHETPHGGLDRNIVFLAAAASGSAAPDHCRAVAALPLLQRLPQLLGPLLRLLILLLLSLLALLLQPFWTGTKGRAACAGAGVPLPPAAP